MKKPLIAGNWKMHKTLAEAKAWVDRVKASLAAGKHAGPSPSLAVFPPATMLYAMVGAVKDAGLNIAIGAQNVHYEPSGAYTGEISAAMIRDVGCSMVLVGHSERRHVFHEPDGWMGRKVTAALDAGLSPIYCVGETLGQREEGRTHAVLEAQLSSGLSARMEVDRVAVAYEPVWAIGTGVNATAEQAREAHGFIRSWLGRTFGKAKAAEALILYGGSVKPGNAGELLSQPDVDGLLVGGASLEAESFIAIAASSV